MSRELRVPVLGTALPCLVQVISLMEQLHPALGSRAVFLSNSLSSH